MPATHVFWHLSEATFGVILVAIITMLGVLVPTLAQQRRTRAKVEDVATKVDTGNGKDLGTTVHDMAQTLEVIQAQQHQNAREIIELGAKVDRHIEKSEAALKRFEEGGTDDG